MTLEINFESFSATYETGSSQAIWTSLVADLETPVSAFLKLTGDSKYSFLLESVEGGSVRGRYSIIGMKPDLIWRCRNGFAEINRKVCDDDDAFEKLSKKPLESLRDLIQESHFNLPDHLPPMSSGLVGYLGYEMVRQMELLPDNKLIDELNLPEAFLIRPTIMAIFDSVNNTITIVTTVRPEGGKSPRSAYSQAEARLAESVSDLESSLKLPANLNNVPLKLDAPSSNTTKSQYHDMVNAAKNYIIAGDIFQVVPSQRFSAPFHLPAFSLYRSLRRLNPSPFLYHLNFGEFSIVGSSPEILIRLRDDVVTLRPIAGTRRRGKTVIEDNALAEELLSDPKECAEHLMLLDLGRNDIGRVSEVGTVNVTEKMIIERYSHVMHIVSNVEGKLKKDLDLIDALIAGFPAGTVSGAPKVRAMEIIEELECSKRGVYAGAVGYFSASGAMDTCIALRTAVIKDNKMYVQAGGGVVADSDPESEYEETVNKAQALFRAAEDALRFAAKIK